MLMPPTAVINPYIHRRDALQSDDDAYGCGTLSRTRPPLHSERREPDTETTRARPPFVSLQAPGARRPPPQRTMDSWSP